MNKIKKDFLENHKDYKNDIDNFFYYLETVRKIKIDDPSMKLVLSGIETEEIKKSLKFIVGVKAKYKKEETAKKYAVAVGQFFEYLRVQSIISNKGFFEEIMANGRTQNSYIGRMMKYIQELENLTPKEALQILDENNVTELLEWCDKQFEVLENWDLPVNFKRAGTAICVKLMLMYGITYREARVLKVVQYNWERDEICLNGFNLRLPIRLNKQIDSYIKYKDVHRICNEENILLTNRDGKQWTTISSSSGIPDLLKSKFGNTDLSGIIKYGICQLLKVGINDHVIKDITGAGDDIISSCIEGWKKEMTDEINNKLVTVDFYYKF